MSLGGQEFTITHGDYTAVLTEIGGGIRQLRHGDRDLVLDYPAGTVRPRHRGVLLAPWPNRVVDGRYRFDGEDYQLDVNEPARHHALHGLVTWQRFDLLGGDGSSVVLRHRIVPRPGYPFEVEVEVRYSLDDDGLTCAVAGHNIGVRRAPYGVSGHPYVVAPSPRVDGYLLQLPAEQVMDVTPDRLIPRGVSSASDLDLDFRVTRELGPTEIDHAFTALVPDPDGTVRTRVLAEDGHGVMCSWDPDLLPWVQVHTADRPDRASSRLGLALEPMTCPPDAFNSGTDLVVLEPGDTHRAWWRLTAL